MQLNFEKLLKNYNEELVTKLRGFNEQELRKILGLNYLRVFKEVVG